jgi:hypothetical protein
MRDGTLRLQRPYNLSRGDLSIASKSIERGKSSGPISERDQSSGREIARIRENTGPISIKDKIAYTEYN